MQRPFKKYQNSGFGLKINHLATLEMRRHFLTHFIFSVTYFRYKKVLKIAGSQERSQQYNLFVFNAKKLTKTHFGNASDFDRRKKDILQCQD
jgi:hypothetical protein